jgi:cytochrome b561
MSERETGGSTTISPDDDKLARYGKIAQLFHWISAALIFVLRSWLLDSWHKPLGLTVIVLTVARLSWKAAQPAVPPANGLAPWEMRLSTITHWCLYGVLLAMPLSGLLMSQGAGRPTSFFGLFDLPQVLAIDPALAPREQANYKLGKWLHSSVIEWGLYLVIGLHLAGALKHRFIDGDRKFMQRMWSWGSE